MLYYSKYIIQF